MADAADAALDLAHTTQSPAGRPEPGAAARSGPWRWGAVAAACAALVAGTMAAAPGVAPTARSAAGSASGRPHALPAGQAPDAAQAQLPLDCGPLPTAVSVSFAADLGDGIPVTVAAAHCQAGGGSAPDGVFILVAGPDGHPVVHDTLLRWQEGFTVTRLALRSDGAVTALAKGYSTNDVPRCCPDLNVQFDWTRQGAGYQRTQHDTPSAAA
ncbi:hypothetical protein [Kitasatospora sp. NBC_01302]|uniref:hypothetical protein n=1 Tax=Kitasatospora sp. NBC_01302 TaxID=2903575 RepID=UPI002E0F4862|nr:hypothetical protein OG294_31890 [Kitasatospora sp. NBC_01302]